MSGFPDPGGSYNPPRRRVYHAQARCDDCGYEQEVSVLEETGELVGDECWMCGGKVEEIE
jgi:hypothetical protein